MSIRTNRWFTPLRPGAAAPRRLFLFPYAGAGASVFRSWGRDLPPALDAYAVQLPGRETRIREPLFTSLPPLIDELTDAIVPWLDRPFAFFGHSMGGLVAFELTRALARIGAPQPRVLFVSARRAPRASGLGSEPMLHTLSDEDLRQDLVSMNGMDPAVLEHQDLMSLLLPIVRADFSVCETYQPRLAPALRVPIVAFGGDADDSVGISHLDAWRSETTAGLAVKVFPGSHFYFKEHWPDVSRTLARYLDQHLAVAPAAIAQAGI